MLCPKGKVGVKDAEEEGAMEEDEVEEMDVVEEEMVGGEDEEVQLVDEVAVDAMAVVLMHQTFHQIVDHHVDEILEPLVGLGLDVTMDEVEDVAAVVVCHFVLVQAKKDGRHHYEVEEVH